MKIKAIQKPSAIEIALAKRLRDLRNGAKVPANDTRIMQDLYFDIQDNGITSKKREVLQRLINAYGSSKDRLLAADLVSTQVKPVKKFDNIYVAVCSLSTTRSTFHSKRLTGDNIKEVLKMVCDALGQPYDGVLSKHRKREYIDCRMITAIIVRDRAGLNMIARAIGRVNHTSILHYFRRADAALERNEKLREVYNEIKFTTGL